MSIYLISLIVLVLSEIVNTCQILDYDMMPGRNDYGPKLPLTVLSIVYCRTAQEF